MDEVNHLELSGIVVDIDGRRVSPSGIPHWEFELEHSSRLDRSTPKQGPQPQVDRGRRQEKARVVRCRLRVRAGGFQFERQLATLAVGQRVLVKGAVAWESHKHEQSRLVVIMRSLTELGRQPEPCG